MQIHDQSHQRDIKEEIQSTDQEIKANDLVILTPYQREDPSYLNGMIIYGLPQGQDIHTNPQFNKKTESESLSDQDFSIQKQQLITVLLGMVAGSIIEFVAALSFLALYENDWDKSVHIVLGASLIFLLLLSIIGEIKSNLAMCVYLGVNILFGISLMSFSRLFNNVKPAKEDGQFLTTADVVSIAVLFQILVNCLVQIIVLYQIRLEESRIHYQPTLLLIAGITIISIYIFPPFVITGLAALFYDLMLLITLNRSLKGDFKLQVNEVIVNVNSITNGIILPCLS